MHISLFSLLPLCRLWECLAIENSNVACICVGLLMECVHFLAHNPSPSTAAKQSPRPQHAHSVSAPVTASSTPTTAEEGEGLGGVVMGRVPGLENVEDGVLWKTLHKGLTAQQWMTKFKTGIMCENIYCALVRQPPAIRILNCALHYFVGHCPAENYCYFLLDAILQRIIYFFCWTLSCGELLFCSYGEFKFYWMLSCTELKFC